MYAVSLEIAGPAAIFTRPDSGSTPVSYPVPTFSAAKGMFEAVARHRGAFLKPLRVEICRPVRFDRYATNYGGPLRKSVQVKGDNNYQLSAVILADVCYRIYGESLATDDSDRSVNHAHALQEIFTRRLERGQTYYAPCLGWKEFTPSYFGKLRPESQPDSSVNLTIPTLLHSVFDRAVNGKVAPSFRQNVRVTAGEMYFEDQHRAE